LGHFLFYEKPEEYLLHPLEIFKIWEGGLASHGAVLGIILGVFLFQRKSLSFTSSLNWLRLLDFISIPAALCGFWIRIGNFFNQEVLGKATQLPWGVIFGHPVDHQLLQEPRHPVQIYEALFYLGVFYFLWRLSLKPYFLKSSGKLIGLFLILVFGFRFFVEYVKMEQSQLVSFSFLTMGQILSIPVVFLGFCFYKRVSTK
jgi:prolipoprotein diacylglyceryl transferase